MSTPSAIPWHKGENEVTGFRTQRIKVIKVQGRSHKAGHVNDYRRFTTNLEQTKQILHLSFPRTERPRKERIYK